MSLYFFFFKDFIYSFSERGEEKEKKRERNISVLLLPTGDLACNPDMCPDWESNQRPFGSQARAQSTELQQPGLLYFLTFIFIPYRRGTFSIGSLVVSLWGKHMNLDGLLLVTLGELDEGSLNFWEAIFNTAEMQLFFLTRPWKKRCGCAPEGACWNETFWTSLDVLGNLLFFWKNRTLVPAGFDPYCRRMLLLLSKLVHYRHTSFYCTSQMLWFL